MDKITLIASDFDDLTFPVPEPENLSYSRARDYSQYVKVRDCPLYRACKRAELNVRAVYWGEIVLRDASIIYAHCHPVDIERCRLELLAGAPEAYITVINTNL